MDVWFTGWKWKSETLWHLLAESSNCFLLHFPVSQQHITWFVIPWLRFCSSLFFYNFKIFLCCLLPEFCNAERFPCSVTHAALWKTMPSIYQQPLLLGYLNQIKCKTAQVGRRAVVLERRGGWALPLCPSERLQTISSSHCHICLVNPVLFTTQPKRRLGSGAAKTTASFLRKSWLSGLGGRRSLVCVFVCVCVVRRRVGSEFGWLTLGLVFRQKAARGREGKGRQACRRKRTVSTQQPTGAKGGPSDSHPLPSSYCLLGCLHFKNKRKCEGGKNEKEIL